MSTENTAATAETAAKSTDKWVNRFGELVAVERATNRAGKPIVRATMRSIGKDASKTFTTKFTASNPKVRAALLDKGIGGFISLRGPIKQVPMEGGKYTVELFEPLMVNEKRAKADPADAAAETAQAGANTAAAAVERNVDQEIPF